MKPTDERVDALFRAAREAPVPAAPPFERMRRRSGSTSTRWVVPWALLPLMAGAAAGSYVVVRAKLAQKPSPVGGRWSGRPDGGPAELHPAAAELHPAAAAPELEPPKPAPVHAPVVHHAPVISRLADDRSEPETPQVPAAGGPIAAPPSTLTEETRLIKVGFNALKTGQPAAARAAFDDYQRRFPRGTLQPEALVGSIRANQALGQYAEALESIERALTVAPERRSELLVLEGELLLADGKPQPAVNAFDRALEEHLTGDLLDRATRGRAAAAK